MIINGGLVNNQNPGVFFDLNNPNIFESNGLIAFSNINNVNGQTPDATNFPKSGSGVIRLNGENITTATQPADEETLGQSDQNPETNVNEDIDDQSCENTDVCGTVVLEGILGGVLSGQVDVGSMNQFSVDLQNAISSAFDFTINNSITIAMERYFLYAALDFAKSAPGDVSVEHVFRAITGYLTSDQGKTFLKNQLGGLKIEVQQTSFYRMSPWANIIFISALLNATFFSIN